MGKLFDLMTMGIKQQVITGTVSVRVTRNAKGEVVFPSPSDQSEQVSMILCASHNPNHLFALSLVHLRTLRRMIQLVGIEEKSSSSSAKGNDPASGISAPTVGETKESSDLPRKLSDEGADTSGISVRALIDETAIAFQEAFDALSLGERQAMWHTVARFLQDRKVKVSFFLADGLQKADGSLTHTISGPLPEGTSPPGIIKYFQPVSAQQGKPSQVNAKYISPIEGMYISSVEQVPALVNNYTCPLKSSNSMLPMEIMVPTTTGVALPPRLPDIGSPVKTAPTEALKNAGMASNPPYISVPTTIVDSALAIWGSNMYVRDRRVGTVSNVDEDNLTVRTLGSFLASASEETKDDPETHAPGLDILDSILSGITSSHALADTNFNLFLGENEEDYVESKSLDQNFVYFPLQEGKSMDTSSRMSALAEKLSLNDGELKRNANFDQDVTAEQDSDYEDLLSMMDNM